MWKKRMTALLTMTIFSFASALPAVATWAQNTLPKDCVATYKLVGQKSHASGTVTSTAWQLEASDQEIFQNGGSMQWRSHVTRFYWVETPNELWGGRVVATGSGDSAYTYCTPYT